MAGKYETIGHYRVLNVLARGANGYVFHAEDMSRRGVSVAVKLMEGVQLHRENERGAFQQEVERLKALQHPSIIPILDAGLIEQFPYIVMPYLPNGSLAERLRQAGQRPLAVQEALAITGQIGSALSYAHQQGVVHRNLTPANILFEANGDALLADFALASLLPEGKKYGAAAGNPLYMAPEQFRGTISKEGDQYALACIAYQMVSGQPPFKAGDFIALGFKHLSDAPFPPTQFNILLPRAVEQVILKAMAKQPADRYIDIAAFIAALGIAPRAWAEPPPARAPVPTALASQTPPRPPEDEEDEGDATVIRPLYGKRPPRAPRRSLKGPPVHRPAAHAGPADPLPRLVDAPAGDQRLSIDAASATARPAVAFASEIAADRAPAASPREQDISAIDTIRTNEVFNLAQADAQAMSMPTHTAPPLPVQHMAARPAPVPAPPRKKRRLGCALVSVVLVALLVLGGALSIMSGALHLFTSSAAAPSSASVTITPTDPGLRAAYTIAGVTHSSAANRQEVQARVLTTSVTASKTMPATGAGVTPGTQARGTLTFFNDSTSPQSFPAGEVYTASNGVQVTNNTGGVIKPGNPNTTPPTWSYVTVLAHAVLAGQAGDIKSKDVNVWKSVGPRGSVVIENSSPFKNGKDAQSYAFVQQGDTYQITDSLESSVNQQAEAALQTQMHTGEGAAGTMRCTRRFSYTHHAGDRAASLGATLGARCQLWVYDQQGALALAEQLFARQIAAEQPRTLATHITATVTQAIAAQAGKRVTIYVNTASSEFTAAQLQALARAIAGKNKQAARTFLLQQHGIKEAAIRLIGGDGQTLPKDAGRITITVPDQA